MKLACALATLALAAGPCAVGAGAARPHLFDQRAAWNLIRKELTYGQRPAGSPELQQLARVLCARMPGAVFEPLAGQPGLRNIVATIPGRRPGIVIGAHYDTLADPPGFVGANNGAAGSAIVVQAARELARLPRKHGGREIRFVLFDGEEPPSGLPEQSTDFYDSGLRGSRAYVAAHPGRTAAMVLLDYVGNRDVFLPREATSTASLWAKVLRAARAAGASDHFSGATGPAFLDDHSPFLRAEVPAVDLIDPGYDGHSTSDTLGKLSLASVDAVGETIVRLALALR